MREIYIAATPIGGVDDITVATLKVLKEADFIICEFIPRVTQLIIDGKWENHAESMEYGQDPSKYPEIHQRILNVINDGKKVIYLPERGSVGIEDPGFSLMKFLEDNGVTLRILPGPSSVIASYQAALPMSDAVSRNAFTFQPIVDLDDEQLEAYIKSYRHSPNALIFIVHDPEMHTAIKLMAKYYGAGRRVSVCMNVSLADQKIVRTTLGVLARDFTPEEYHNKYTTIVVDGCELPLPE